ncbi:MAG: hypothetical protein HW403_257 [Dehalococcoidia bacterium]|nr:hypothetical protein [Dehalococcoidia bacterium]
MEVSDKIKELCARLGAQFGAEEFYVIDVEDSKSPESAGALVFGMRNSSVSALQARGEASRILTEATDQAIGAEIFTDPFEEIEYLFDRYLRAYIATHGGIVTPVKVDEEDGTVWVDMEGGCSMCPASIGTLKLGIERTLKKHLPWVRRVESTAEPIEPDFGIKLNLSAGVIGR